MVLRAGTYVTGIPCAISVSDRFFGTSTSSVSAEPPKTRKSIFAMRCSFAPSESATRRAVSVSIWWRWPYSNERAYASYPSASAIASVVVESIPPLKRTTAGFILVDCHPERSKAKSKDPAEIPSVSQRDSSTSLGMTTSFLLAASHFSRILGANSECNSAASRELCGHSCVARRACFYEIVQNAVRDRFIEGALIPIRSQIKLERLAFDTEAVWHVIDINPGEIRLAGDRTNRSEIIGFKMNPVIPTRCGIRKSLQPRLGR